MVGLAMLRTDKRAKLYLLIFNHRAASKEEHFAQALDAGDPRSWSQVLSERASKGIKEMAVRAFAVSWRIRGA
jgi:hypothetical protein